MAVRNSFLAFFLLASLLGASATAQASSAPGERERSGSEREPRVERAHPGLRGLARVRLRERLRHRVHERIERRLERAERVRPRCERMDDERRERLRKRIETRSERRPRGLRERRATGRERSEERERGERLRERLDESRGRRRSI